MAAGRRRETNHARLVPPFGAGCTHVISCFPELTCDLPADVGEARRCRLLGGHGALLPPVHHHHQPGSPLLLFLLFLLFLSVPPPPPSFGRTSCSGCRCGSSGPCPCGAGRCGVAWRDSVVRTGTIPRSVSDFSSQARERERTGERDKEWKRERETLYYS